MEVRFTCDPQRVDALIAALDGVVSVLRQDGPGEALVAQVREEFRVAREEERQSDGWWLHAFADALRRGADPTEILAYEAILGTTTREDLRELASLLSDDTSGTVVLLPGQ